MTSQHDQPKVASAENNIPDWLLNELPEQYDLLDKVSEGGMGTILKARNKYTGLPCAIKVLRCASTAKENATKRFIIEAKAASLIDHPGVCRVYDFGLTKNKIPYLVMDWVDGITLSTKIARDGHLPAEQVVPIFQQVVSALSHAHAKKVVHRDMKPENIMLSRDTQGRTKVHLVDFGIAKVLSDEENSPQSHALTSTGMVIGTPLFMSPEQAKGTAVDTRTDIYSLGCVMYFALTGNPPFIGDTVIGTISKHLNEPPPPFDPALKIPADLRMIIFKAMEKSVDDRYQDMDELSVDLKKLTKGVSLERHVLSEERKSTRKKLIVALCFALGFLMSYLLSIGLQGLLDSSDRHAPPEHFNVHRHSGK